MLLTIQEVAERYQVSRETVARWVRSGDMSGINLGTASRQILRFHPDELARFERSRMTQVTVVNPEVPAGPVYI